MSKDDNLFVTVEPTPTPSKPASREVPKPVLFPPNDVLFANTPPRPQKRTTRPRKAIPATAPVSTTVVPQWLADAPPRRIRRSVEATVGNTIAPVETRYAGCRFRSRLEARWAVWFDHLGIEWHYEPETYKVGPNDRRRGYLPDFFLPGDNVWVEVKGDENALNYQLLADAADPYYGLPLSLGDQAEVWATLQVRVMMLGPVPAAPGFHAALGIVMGSNLVRQLVTPFCDMSVVGSPERMTTPHGHTIAPMYHPIDAKREESTPTGLLTSFGYGSPCPQIKGAYTSARSARFEHGESG